MTDIIERAREALAFSDSLISSDELHALAPALARIAIAADELAEAVEKAGCYTGMDLARIDKALAAFKSAKEWIND